ncbi:hypothetical protein [Candidatus Oleimmundimicrobium sp.]|uniref:hypothetical protein n=1 Tax=Candidatus Oleimmundimicrobium sp. TaxID=3060597 RepID=UPI002717E3B1|nr:hypothetical protein [Candidatus Oleimmundimicrobium sp.]MDO8885727.1 hypothetical protein [Candidatus Oleimmundimicrobium sp.]
MEEKTQETSSGVQKEETSQETPSKEDIVTKLETLKESSKMISDIDLIDDFDDEVITDEDEETDWQARAQTAERELKRQKVKDAVGKATSDYPLADSETLLDMARKGRPETQIREVAKKMQLVAQKRDAHWRTQIDEVLKDLRKEDIGKVEETKKEIISAWGKPLTGGTGDSAKPLTIAEFKRLPKDEQIRRADEVQRSDNTKI